MMIENFVTTWLTPEIIEQMGECAYQRVLCAFSIGVPLITFAFSVFLAGAILWGVFRAVCRR